MLIHYFRKGANGLEKWDIVTVQKYTGDPTTSNFFIEKLKLVTNTKKRMGKPLRFVPPSIASQEQENVNTRRKVYNTIEPYEFLFNQCRTVEENNLLKNILVLL